MTTSMPTPGSPHPVPGRPRCLSREHAVTMLGWVHAMVRDRRWEEASVVLQCLRLLVSEMGHARDHVSWVLAVVDSRRSGEALAEVQRLFLQWRIA